MEAKLREIYYDPSTGLSSAKQLYEKVKIFGYSMNDVIKWLATQESHQIFKPPVKNFSAIVGHTDADYQMDTMFLEQYKKQNKGFIGLMTFIEITSRYGYAVPIKNKTQSEMNRAFDIFYKKVNNHVINITSDNEASFKKTIKRYPKIKHWLSDVGDKTKMGKVERFNRTIRDKITKYMKTFKTANWIDAIEKLLNNYNNSIHSSIKMAPSEVNEGDIEEIQKNEREKGNIAIDEYNSFSVGDKVRLLKTKGKFEKGTDIFSRGIYTIVKSEGLSFILENPKKKVLTRKYKNWEIRKVEKIDKPPEQTKPTSFKKIKKVNKFRNKQIREFNKGKKHEVKEITDVGEVILKPRLQPKNVKRTQTPAEKIINKRINVYWPDLKRWYKGTVTGYDSERKEHIVKYDQPTSDGEHDIFEKLYKNDDTDTKIVRWKYV